VTERHIGKCVSLEDREEIVDALAVRQPRGGMTHAEENCYPPSPWSLGESVEILNGNGQRSDGSRLRNEEVLVSKRARRLVLAVIIMTASATVFVREARADPVDDCMLVCSIILMQCPTCLYEAAVCLGNCIAEACHDFPEYCEQLPN
jgi:hypothetical protein